MAFAIDACVPEQLAQALRALGSDVVSTAGRAATPDQEVLSGAFARDRVLITWDKDFGDLVFRDGEAAVGVVLIRFDLVSEAAVKETAKTHPGTSAGRARPIRGVRTRQVSHAPHAGARIRA